MADASTTPPGPGPKLSRFPQWQRVSLIAALAVATLLLVYLPAVRSGFIWDDDAYVTNNLTLRSTDGLAQIWTNITSTPQYYPLVFTSFRLEYQFWELNP